MLNFLHCLQFCYFFLSDVISLSFCSLFSEITSVFSSNLSIELFCFPIFKAVPSLLNILSDHVRFFFRVYCFSNSAHLDVPLCFLSVWNVLPADTCTAYCLSSIRVWLPWSFIWNYNPAPTSSTPVCPESLVFSFFCNVYCCHLIPLYFTFCLLNLLLLECILAWRIPGTEDPNGLPSKGSHRVGHNWSDLAAAAAECKLDEGKSFCLLLSSISGTYSSACAE